jgi:hypothetical protein
MYFILEFGYFNACPPGFLSEAHFQISQTCVDVLDPDALGRLCQHGFRGPHPGVRHQPPEFSLVSYTIRKAVAGVQEGPTATTHDGLM